MKSAKKNRRYNYQKGGPVKPMSRVDELKGLLSMTKNALIGEPTGTMLDRVPMPGNELGIMSEVKGIGSMLSSLFKGSKPSKAVSKEIEAARVYFGNNFEPGFTKVGGPNPFSTSKHGLTIDGRDVLLVKNETTGEIQPFYRRTGMGNSGNHGGINTADDLNTQGTWVPYHGHGVLPDTRTGRQVNNWFIKPVQGRGGNTQLQSDGSWMLNRMLGTGEKGALNFKNRFNDSELGSMLTTQHGPDGGKAVNSLYRAYGFEPTPYANYYGIQAHKYGGMTKKIKKYPYGDTVDLSGILNNPLLGGFLDKSNDFATKFTPGLTPQITTNILGDAPTKMSAKDFMISKGFNPGNPLNIFKKGYGKLDRQYKDYKNQYKEDTNTYNTNASSIGSSISPLLGSLSTLMQGVQGQQNYDQSQGNERDMTDSYGFQGYQDGGNVDQMMNQDPWLQARGQIESSGNQDSVSGAGAVGMFQITPIALKEYNRKYDSQYTWDQIKENPAANAHVSNALIKDIRSMINKVDSTLGDFDKNVLAEMAYNYGPYRFLNKLKAKGRDVTLDQMINDTSLPLETRNHGKKFVKYFGNTQETSVPRPQEVKEVRQNPVSETSQTKRFSGDPYEYKKEGDKYYYRKGLGDFKEINNAGRAELKKRNFQYGGFTGKVSQRDSVANMAGKTMDYESLRGGDTGQPLSNSGYFKTQLPYYQANNNWRPPTSKKEAVQRYMEEIAPRIDELGAFQTAMEKSEAGDFLYNTGRDPRVYLLDQYLKSTGNKNGLSNRTDYNVDTKLPEWQNHLPKFENEWSKHKDAISRLSENDRRILLNKGRDFYYQHTSPIGYKGSLPHPSYDATWKGRIANTNEYAPFNSNDPRFVNGFAPLKKHQYGGTPAQVDTLSNLIKFATNSDSIYNTALDPKKHFIAANPDSTLVRSGLRQVYSRDNNQQIGFINQQGQFMPMTNNMVRFEGKQSAFIPSVAQKQMGGNVNTTGYLEGSPTENNPYNIIPSPNITMEGVNQPINAIPMTNGNFGKPVKMKPGLNYYFPNADQVLEIPDNPSHAQYGQVAGLGRNKEFGQRLNDPLGLQGQPQLEDVPYLKRSTAPQFPAPEDNTPEIVPQGFIRPKGDKWMYKDNGDGSYTVIDTTRPDRKFKLDGKSKNKDAFIAVDKMFNKTQSKQDLRVNDSRFNTYNSDPYSPSWYVKDVNNREKPQVLPYIPGIDSAKQEVLPYIPSRDNTRVNTPAIYGENPTIAGPDPFLSFAPTSAYNPYKGNVPQNTTTGPEDFLIQNHRDLSHWSNRIPNSWNAGAEIAPYLAGIGGAGALYKGARESNAIRRVIQEGMLKKITSKNANKIYGELENLIQDDVTKRAVQKAMVKKIGAKAANKAINNASRYGSQYFKYGGHARRYQMGDEVEQQDNQQEESQEPQVLPIQTEKGEKIYHLDKSISNTAAKKLHKNMDDDIVTDIVTEGVFIGSRDPKMSISKKEANQIVLGNYAVKYEQGKPSKLPKTIKFGDIFTKKKHTPSELMGRIDKKFPLSKQENNIFTELANEENRSSRDQYMGIVKYMTEVKKPYQDAHYRYGGNVKKYQLGAILGGIGSLIPQVASMFTQSANKNATLQDINKYEQQNNGYLNDQVGLSSLSNLLGYATQDNTPEIYNPDQALQEFTNPYQRAIQNVGQRQEQNYNSGRSFANDAYSRLANIDPRLAATTASTIGSNAYRQAGQENSRLGEYRDQLGINLGSGRSQMIREALLNKQQTLAGVRSNKNQMNAGLFGNFAKIGNDYYSGKANIGNTALTARMGARGQYGNFISNMGYGVGNSLYDIGSGIAGLGTPAPTAQSNYNFSNVNRDIYNDRADTNRNQFNQNPLRLPALSTLPQIKPR